MNEIYIILTKTVLMMIGGLGFIAIAVFGFQVYDYLNCKYGKKDNTNWDLY